MIAKMSITSSKKKEESGWRNFNQGNLQEDATFSGLGREFDYSFTSMVPLVSCKIYHST